MQANNQQRGSSKTNDRRGPREAAAGSFGRRLRDARQSQGLTLRAVAAASDVSIAYLSDLERGVLENPTLDKLRSIAQALDVSLNELLEVEGKEAARRPRRPVKALRQLEDLPSFQDAIKHDAERLEVSVDELRAEWLELLGRIEIAGRRPRSGPDFFYLFDAIRRVLGPR